MKRLGQSPAIFDLLEATKLGRQERNDEGLLIPDISLFSLDSNAMKLVHMKYNCRSKLLGIFTCEPIRSAAKSGGSKGGWVPLKGASGGVSKPARPAQQGSKKGRSGSCLERNECDINSDYICATKKGMMSTPCYQTDPPLVLLQDKNTFLDQSYYSIKSKDIDLPSQ